MTNTPIRNSKLWFALVCIFIQATISPSVTRAQKNAKQLVSEAVIAACRNAEYKTIPELPFRIGDSIPFLISVKFKTFPFDKNTQLVITPEVHFRNKIVPLKTMRFKAVVKPNQYPALNEDSVMASLSRKGNYHFEHEVIFPYELGVESATLEARVTIIEGNISQELPLIRISNKGFSSFTRLLKPSLELMDLNYEREQLCVKEIHTLFYPPNDYELNNILNPSTFNELLKTLKSSREILEIKITSSASPEGEAKNNESLAFKRMEIVNKLIVKELLSRTRNAMSSAEVFENGFITTKWTEQNWDSLLPLIDKKMFPDFPKLNAINSDTVSIKIKQELLAKFVKGHPYLSNSIFPKLRNCSIEILSTPSDQSIINDIELFQNKTLPSSTLCTRLIQMAIAADSDLTAMAIYQFAIKLYPDDFRAHFKIGMMLYNNGKYEDAEKSFQQSSLLNPKSAESKNNLGVVQAILRKFEVSMQNFEMAANQNRPSSTNRAYVSAQLGRFRDALNWFGPEATFNRAICWLGLSQPYQALDILDSIKSGDAMAHYLMAIAGTRINDIALICDQLRKAIAIDIKFRNMAKTEADFNPYRLNPQFREAMKMPPMHLRVDQ